tara:strand:- start:763 stop:1029 length:267 start_codon:yes stop_codon:yes gene_type:complete
MAANGISTLTLKATRQDTKLAKATAKREGKTVAADGTISGSTDPSAVAYRERNTLNLSQLPTRYNASSNTGALVDNAGTLVVGRPWTA